MQGYGIDLAMKKFDVSIIDKEGNKKDLIINNKPGAIARFLKQIPADAILCAEYTGVYR